jgi:hypothetical protein
VAPSGDDAQRSGDLSGIAISAGTTSPAVDALVIDDAGMLEPHLDAWDHLAVLRRQPYSAPAWMLAWWRQAAPRESRLRVVVVRDGGEVVGIAAWHQDRLATGLRVARLLGTGHRVEPLALPGHEATVARAVTAALARLPDGPGALSLDRADAGSAWPGLLAAGRGSAVVERETTGAPVVRLDGRTWAEWLATRSRNFRSQRAQGRRRLAEHGAVARLAEKPDAIETAVEAFLRLTAARWNTPAWNRPRGGGIGEMLREAARDLVPRGRMRIWVLVADGTPLSVQLFLGAGDEWSYWNGGFDRRWARLRPGFETLSTRSSTPARWAIGASISVAERSPTSTAWPTPTSRSSPRWCCPEAPAGRCGRPSSCPAGSTGSPAAPPCARRPGFSGGCAACAAGCADRAHLDRRWRAPRSARYTGGGRRRTAIRRWPGKRDGTVAARTSG